MSDPAEDAGSFSEKLARRAEEHRREAAGRAWLASPEAVQTHRQQVELLVRILDEGLQRAEQHDWVHMLEQSGETTCTLILRAPGKAEYATTRLQWDEKNLRLIAGAVDSLEKPVHGGRSFALNYVDGEPLWRETTSRTEPARYFRVDKLAEVILDGLLDRACQ
jgi:hypothetical protein